MQGGPPRRGLGGGSGDRARAPAGRPSPQGGPPRRQHIQKVDIFDHFEDAPGGGTIFHGIPHGWGQSIAAGSSFGPPSSGSSYTTSTEEVVAEHDPGMDANAKLALESLRPSAAALQAGADLVGSAALRAEPGRLLRCVGQRSASKWLGDKVGPPPRTDDAADKAWLYLAENPHIFETIAMDTLAAAPVARKEALVHFFRKLLTPRGLLVYLRGFARMLYEDARPQAAAAGSSDPAINWSACWAWRAPARGSRAAAPLLRPPPPPRMTGTRTSTRSRLATSTSWARRSSVPCRGCSRAACSGRGRRWSARSTSTATTTSRAAPSSG